MSTKTSIKRIALVAVSALSIGLIAALPSNAVVADATITDASDKGGLGVAQTTLLSFTTTVNAETATISFTKPAASARTLASITWTVDAGDDCTYTAATGTFTDVTTAVDCNGTISFTPDVQGTYKFTLTAGASTDTYTIYASDLYVTTADGLTGGLEESVTANGVAGVANSVTLAVRGIAASPRLVTITGGITLQPSAGNLTRATSGAAITVAAVAAVNTFTVATTAEGTITVNFYDESQPGIYSSTPKGTVTITVASAAQAGAVDADESSVTMSLAAPGTGAVLAADALSAVAPRGAGVARAVMDVELLPLAGTLSALTRTTITVDGPGYVVVTGGTTNSTGRSVTETGADGVFAVTLYSDGASGVSTVTITNGSFTEKRTVTFYGAVASYSLTAKNSVLSVGTTDAEIFTFKALDSAGVTVPGATVYVTSGTTSVATVPSNQVTTDTSGLSTSIGATAAGKGSSVITLANAATSATVTATYTLNVVKAGVSSVALSFDKDTYAPGELATISVTAKNVDADLVGDQEYANLFTASGITSSAALNGYAASAAVTTTNGVKTYKVYMPLASGPVTISATLGASVAAAIQATTVTASTKVGASAAEEAANAASDAALEAIDAANAATDAANLAAEAADAATVAAEEARDAADAATAAVEALASEVATLIAGLKAQITTLANTVAKIAKKVKA